MNVSEYVKEFNLKGNNKFDREKFVISMRDDFSKMLEGQMNPVIFENKVSDLRKKWDNIFNKSTLNSEQVEKFWKFFFATIIIPRRNLIFPGNWKDVKHAYKMKTDPIYNQKHNNWKRWREEEEWINSQWEQTMRIFFGGIEPVELRASKVLLGIDPEAKLNKEMIEESFRSMSKKCHPDRGGTHQDFINLSSAKEIALSYCEAV